MVTAVAYGIAQKGLWPLLTDSLYIPCQRWVTTTYFNSFILSFDQGYWCSHANSLSFSLSILVTCRSWVCSIFWSAKLIELYHFLLLFVFYMIYILVISLFHLLIDNIETDTRIRSFCKFLSWSHTFNWFRILFWETELRESFQFPPVPTLYIIPSLWIHYSIVFIDDIETDI
jgi:hypothetical protein